MKRIITRKPKKKNIVKLKKYFKENGRGKDFRINCKGEQLRNN